MCSFEKIACQMFLTNLENEKKKQTITPHFINIKQLCE